MTTDLLARLLDELASDVRAPQFAEGAWRRAGQVRRRRRAVGTSVAAGVTVGAVAVGIGVGVPDRDPRTVAPISSPSVTRAAGPVPETGPVPEKIDRMPDRLARVVEPGLAIPTDITDSGTATAAPLSTHRLTRATMVIQRVGQGDDTPEPVYAYGADGSWARLDVIPFLRFTHDIGGNAALPLKNTSLSPDGRRVAFPQPDEVILVDLTTAGVRRIPVPGLNEHVLWQADGSIIVGGDGSAYLVQPGPGTRTRITAPLSIWDLVVGGNELMDLPFDANKVRVWTPGSTRPLREEPLNTANLTPYQTTTWYNRGWRRADLVVRVGWSSPPGDGEVVTVIDLRTLSVVRILPLGASGGKGTTTALGWIDPDTVALRTGPDGILRWNIRTGEVGLLCGPLAGVITIAPTG